jgi:hypothetical protein
MSKVRLACDFANACGATGGKVAQFVSHYLCIYFKK